jgi:hypothetical protein
MTTYKTQTRIITAGPKSEREKSIFHSPVRRNKVTPVMSDTRIQGVTTILENLCSTPWKNRAFSSEPSILRISGKTTIVTKATPPIHKRIETT